MSNSGYGKQVRFFKDLEAPIVVLKYVGRGGEKYFKPKDGENVYMCGGRYGYVCVLVDDVKGMLNLGEGKSVYFKYATQEQNFLVNEEIRRRLSLRKSGNAIEKNSSYSLVNDLFGGQESLFENENEEIEKTSNKNEEEVELEIEVETDVEDIETEEVAENVLIASEEKEPLIVRKSSRKNNK